MWRSRWVPPLLIAAALCAAAHVSARQDQDAAKIAKALADRLSGSLGVEGTSGLAGAPDLADLRRYDDGFAFWLILYVRPNQNRDNPGYFGDGFVAGRLKDHFAAVRADRQRRLLPGCRLLRGGELPRRLARALGLPASAESLRLQVAAHLVDLAPPLLGHVGVLHDVERLVKRAHLRNHGPDDQHLSLISGVQALGRRLASRRPGALLGTTTRLGGGASGIEGPGNAIRRVPG